MTDAEKCKEEVLQIMEKYNCRFVLDWEDELIIEDKKTLEVEHFTWFNQNER